MRWWGVIPARWSSRRLPGKVAATIGGRSMLERVWRATVDARFERAVVATDSLRVARLARSFGAEVRITGPADSGTARASRVVPADVAVAVVQADLPGLRAGHLRVLRRTLDHADVGTVWTQWSGDPDDPAVVKIRIENDRVSDFARRPFPDVPLRQHVGLYAFSPGWLGRCARSPRSPRAAMADLEQLTWLDLGFRIGGREVDCPGPSVDTWAQLVRARAVLGESP